jgi:hypothetical protein
VPRVSFRSYEIEKRALSTGSPGDRIAATASFAFSFPEAWAGSGAGAGAGAACSAGCFATEAASSSALLRAFWTAKTVAPRSATPRRARRKGREIAIASHIGRRPPSV